VHGHGHTAFWVVVLVLFVALLLLAIFAVVHLVRRPSPGAEAPAAGVADPAVGSARLRYARGEIDREEFVRVSTDLGAVPPAPA
jgi:uncharacterized membrane protein